MAMLFKIGFKKDQQRGTTSAFTVTRVEHQDNDLISKMIEEDKEYVDDFEQLLRKGESISW
nr:uncharacterized protein LOC109191718 [Ipomoea trifida]GME07596.1 replication factor A protein 1-like [Ipomoea batatas]GME12038.1 replication factor A protein 1-like [Ipomoea batatas]